MTKRLETMVAVASILTWTVSSEAQSGVPGQREALAVAYVNSETGLTLAQAIARALTQEPTLGASRTAVEVAMGELLQAGLRPNPSVSFMQQNQPGGTDSQTRVELQWPLDLFRKSGRVHVAEQELHAAQHGVSDRERALVIDVRMKYGELVAAIRDLSVNDDLVTTMTRQAELLRARVEEGSTPPLERNMVEVELRRLEADRFLQAGQVDRMAIELKRLLGMRAGDSLQVRDSLEQLVDREMDAPLKADVAVALRSDVQEAEARLRMADAQVDRAQRDGRFDMNVFGSYMRMDATFPQFGVNTRGDLVPIHGLFHYLSAGVTVIVPLRNQNQGEVAKAQGERAGATARLTAAQMTAEAEVGAARARDERARRALAIYREGARELARQNLDVVRQTSELGRATVFDVLTEQRRYLDVERSYSNALREAYEARTALRRALGDVR